MDTGMIKAIKGLLNCPDLNHDSLEDLTADAIHEANKALETTIANVSEDELLDLTMDCFCDWAEEELIENLGDGVSREQRYEETFDTFTERLKERINAKFTGGEK